MKKERLELRETGENVYEAALARVRTIYDMCDEVAVSFSGGKDSTALLHVVLEVAHERGRLPLKAFFFDEEAIHPETIEYVERVRARDDVDLIWFCVPISHRNAGSWAEPTWYPWAPEKRDVWCRDLPDGAVTDIEGFRRGMGIPDCVPLLVPRGSLYTQLLGIRAQESMTRRQSVTNREYLNYLVRKEDGGRGGYWIGKPIYDWKTEDVWTALDAAHRGAYGRGDRGRLPPVEPG